MKIYLKVFTRFILAITLFVSAAYARSMHFSKISTCQSEILELQLFNQDAQQKITALINENEQLKNNLSELKGLDKVELQDKKNIDNIQSNQVDKDKKTRDALVRIYNLHSHRENKKASEEFARLARPQNDNVQAFYDAIDELIKSKLS